MKDPLDINFYYDIITESGPVPNGLVKFHETGKFEQTTLWHKPFDASFIDNPSLVQPICNFYESMLCNNCSVSLYTKDEHCENLFYPIELSFNGINISIPDKTLKRLRSGELKLLLLAQIYQGYSSLLPVKRVAIMFKQMGIPEENIIIVTGDVNNTFKEMFSPFRTYSIDWWQIESKLIINNETYKYDVLLRTHVPDMIMPVKDYDINQFEPKLLFHTHSKFDTIHRGMLLDRLKSNNLYKKGTVKSDGDKFQYHTNSLFTILTPPFSPDKDSIYKSEVNSVFTDFELWELIAMGKPFIVIGCQQIIKYLNTQGYFTFYDLINEKYDSYVDHNIKINLICQELLRICDKDNGDILKIIKQYATRNKQKFLSRSHLPNFLNLFDEIRYG